MNKECWKEKYKKIKDLKPYQIKLLDDGPQSLSQAWLFNYMWSEWNDIQKNRDYNLNVELSQEINDPWDD